METAVKVSLGPHRQTKDIQHLNCLLTCWCQSWEPAVMPSQGVQITQRRLNPLAAKWEKKGSKRVLDASCLIFICSSLISVWPTESNNEPPGLQEDGGKSVSHIEPRLLFSLQCKFPYTRDSVTVSHRWEEASQDTRCLLLFVVLERWKRGSFFYDFFLICLFWVYATAGWCCFHDNTAVTVVQDL